MSHAFISYLREDGDQIDRLSRDLQVQGIDVWLDRDQIQPGAQWQEAIKHAVQDGAFFLACFSANYPPKHVSFMDEELKLALELLKSRSTDWLIPIRLTNCAVPDLRVGDGPCLRDFQWVDLFEDWAAGVQKLTAVLASRAVTTERQQPDEFARHLREQELEERARNAVLSDVLSSSENAIAVTCVFGKGPKELKVRPDATLGELCTAVARDRYGEEFPKNDYYFGATPDKPYASAITVAELRKRGIDKLTMCVKPSRGGVIAAAMPRQPVEIPRLGDHLGKLRGTRGWLLWLRARLGLWLFSLPGVRHRSPPAWLAYQLNELAFLYSEAGVHVDRAVRLVQLLERSKLSEDWAYRDTIAWVWYRAGFPHKASELAQRQPDAAVRDVGVNYHLYFICKRIGDEQTARLVREWFSRRFPAVDWSNRVRLEGPDGMTADLFWYELEVRRVLSNDDTLAITPVD